jgi:hypothetical protein
MLSGGAISATALLWRFSPHLQNIDETLPDLPQLPDLGVGGDLELG